jgi:glycosyltransferase involved in cell wall biosynthesis
MNIAFIYYTNNSDAIGIDNKMLSYNNAAIKLNHNAILLKIYSSTFSNELKNIFKICKTNYDVYLIRYNNSRNIFIFFLILWLKIKKKKIILDVPTPITNYLRELDLNTSISLQITLIKAITYILGPLPFILSDLVVQYAEESTFFNPKYVNTILIGNGIDSNEIISLVNSKNESDQIIKYNLDKVNFLNIVSIGSIAPWHGWDKLINLMTKINETRQIPLRYYIIGDGAELEKLKKLVFSNKLEKSVFFLGKMKREDYVPFISSCDLGIGSLGWERVGVKTASPLKSREYICCGIPVVFTAFDKDISNTNYGFQVDFNKSSIFNFFSTYKITNVKCDKNAFKTFSLQVLDMKNKLFMILNHVKSN